MIAERAGDADSRDMAGTSEMRNVTWRYSRRVIQRENDLHNQNKSMFNFAKVQSEHQMTS